MVSIPFCGTAQPKALAVFFISVVGAIIGASLVFNQLLVQVPKDERYEGYFNAANYHVFTVVCVILIQCGQSMYNYGGFASKAWKYLGFPAAGILIFWITGTIEPHAGSHGFRCRTPTLTPSESAGKQRTLTRTLSFP